MKVAILGATGHIAKNLIVYLYRNPDYELILYARNLELVNLFLKTENLNDTDIRVLQIDAIYENKCDVIINCIGIGDPSKLRKAGNEIFRLTEYFDNLILEYLRLNKEVRYINLSSGAAYGTDFTDPPNENTMASVPINDISATEYYSIAKLYSEAKHRACSEFNIIDLRVFGFFSRMIDLTTPYLINDIINCVIAKKPLITFSDDIIRDYIHPEDLVQIVDLCIKTEGMNDVFDIYSSMPIRKFDIIKYFVENHQLQVIIQETMGQSATGTKSNYFTRNERASQIGYVPQFTSLESIITQSESLLIEMSDSR